MKKRKGLLLIFGTALCLCTVGLVVGCGTTDENNHVHKYKESVISSTCTEAGYTLHICSCGESYKDNYVSANGHVAQEAVRENETEATCKHGGYYDEVVRCAVCNEIITSTPKTTDKIPHNYVDGICSECGDDITQLHVHKYINQITPPTCKDKGYTTHTCACGDSYIDSYVDKTNVHTPKAAARENEVPATCTGEGSYNEVVRCNVCNAVISTTIKAIEKKPHTWGDWTEKDNENHKRTCGVCKTEETKNHEYGGKNGDVCTKCAHTDAPATIKSINGATINQVDKTVKLTVDKTTTRLLLSNMVTVSSHSGWKIYDDSIIEVVKTIPLSDGYNTFYITVTDTQDSSIENTYTFTVYKSFEVTLNYYGVYDDIIHTETIDTGYEFTVNYTPEITGYTFNHWKLSGEQTTKFMPFADVNLYADCMAKTFGVTFDANGGTCETTSLEYVYDDSITLPAISRVGYTLTGWYYGDQKETSGTWKIAEDCTLTAHWQINSYKLTVVCDDNMQGSVSGGGTYNYNTSITATATTYVGYTFIGWYNGEQKLSEEVNYTFNIPAESVTYTAKWKVSDAMANFVFNSSETICSVTGIKDKTVTEIVVPDYVNFISHGAFSGCGSLTSITLPFVGGSIKTVTDTYQYPFGYIFGKDSYTGGTGTQQYYYGSSTSYTTHSTFYIPSSLKSVTIIGGNILCRAFEGCSRLTSITIPDSVTSIGDYAFRDCSRLTSITIPDSVTSIGNSAFRDCSSLTGATIPDSVTSIGNSAFNGCSGLTSVTIPDGVTSIGNFAFSDCSGLTSVTIENGVTSIGEYAFSGCSGLTSITISDSVTSIGEYAFRDCTKLTSITIPDSVTSIGFWAFEGCNGLSSLTIPDGVTSIGFRAFEGCNGLVSITVESGNTKYHSAGNCLIETASKTLILGCKNSVIPTDRSVTSIGEYAFWDCTKLTSITIPDSVTSIGFRAFEGCNGLTSVTIPDGVTSIGDYAFGGCSGLTSVTIENGVTSIGDYAFGGCSGLTSITFSDSVTSIGFRAFEGCNGLKAVYYKGTEAEWNSISIDGYNTHLTSATRYYYSETAPTDSGSYWHYDGNGEVKVWLYAEDSNEV